MPIDRARILEIIGYNRAYISEIETYFRAKTAALWRWFRYYLDAELRGRYIALLDRLTMEGRLEWLRHNAWRIERLGATRSAFYARAILFETALRREIAELDIYLSRIAETTELLKAAIYLKEREVSFLEDLLVRLREYVPERPAWQERVERVLGLVRKWLDELRKMIGSLTGHVFDDKTKKPIKGAVVEVAGLTAATNAEGYYRIDYIPIGSYTARCTAAGYEKQEVRVEIKGGAVVVKDWYLTPIVIVPITRILQSRMFYRSYRAKYTPDPFAFLVVFVKTRDPDNPIYSEASFKSALDTLTEDPEGFETLGYAVENVGERASKKGYRPVPPAKGGAYFVDGREGPRQIDMDEVEEEAEKLDIRPAEKLIDQIRYYCAFYRVRGGIARIYAEYVGWLEFKKGRWIIHSEMDKTRYSPEEVMIDVAPSPEELET